MDAPDHKKPHSSGNESHGAHICNKCGWQYPNPHPSAKHRRAHKKICGTIEDQKLIDSEKTKPNPVLDDEHLSDYEHKTPSENTIGGTGAISSRSQEEVFVDAVCEFSNRGVDRSSDLSEENKEPEATDLESVTENAGEFQQCKFSSNAFGIRNTEVLDSSRASPAEVLEAQDLVRSSTRTTVTDQKVDQNSVEDESLTAASETSIESSQACKVVDLGGTAKDIGLETDQQRKDASPEENLPDDFASELASMTGKRKYVGESAWNDEVIYSEVDGPDGFAEEYLGIDQSTTENDNFGIDNASVDSSLVQTNATQIKGINDSVVATENSQGITVDKDDVIPIADNADKANNEEEYETSTADYEESLGIVQFGQISVGSEDTSPYTISLQVKNEHKGQTDLAVVEELPVQEKVEVSKDRNTIEESISAEHIQIPAKKFDACESHAGTSQNAEALRIADSGLDPVTVDTIADVNCTGGRDNRETRNEGNNAADTIVTESTGVSECHVRPVLNVLEGDDSDHGKGPTETCKDSSPLNDGGICGNTSGARVEWNGGPGEKNILTERTNTQEDELSHSGSALIESDTRKTNDQELPRSERTDFDGISGVPGVTEGNEIDKNGSTQTDFAEIPVSVELNLELDCGQSQNLSESQTGSVVSSSITTGNATHASEDASIINCHNKNSTGDVSVHSSETSGCLEAIRVSVSETQQPENPSQHAPVVQTTSEEIVQKINNQNNTTKQQHVPLKHLLSEARSPRQNGKDDNDDTNNSSSVMPKVRSILGPEISAGSGLPVRGEASEEWKTPGAYPVDMKKEERKVKGRPFWVPFVCCSSAH